jgi:hypothetical protein
MKVCFHDDMVGTQITLFPRRVFDYSSVAQGEMLTTHLIKAIDVSQYTEGTLLVRVHSRTNIRGDATFKVVLAITSPTAEDPATDFLRNKPVAEATVNSATEVPSLMVEQLTAGFGAQLAVFVRATRPAGDTGPIQAELSAELVLKC